MTWLAASLFGQWYHKGSRNQEVPAKFPLGDGNFNMYIYIMFTGNRANGQPKACLNNVAFQDFALLMFP